MEWEETNKTNHFKGMYKVPLINCLLVYVATKNIHIIISWGITL